MMAELQHGDKKIRHLAADIWLICVMLMMLLNAMTVWGKQVNGKQAHTFICTDEQTTGAGVYQTDRMLIEQLMRDWEMAVQQEDFAALGAMVTEEAEFWTQETEPLIGRTALVAAFEPFLAEYKMQQDYQCQEMIITGDWAFLRGLELNTLTNKATGDVRISKQRAFSVLQKDGQGQWRFARGMTHRPPID